MKNQHQAVRRLLFYYERGATTFLSVDIKSYFDSIDHDLLFGLIAEEIPDEKFLKLLRRNMRAIIYRRGRIKSQNKGVSQGGILSPLFANIYLNELDRILTDRGFCVVRYADDITVACINHEEALAAKRQISSYLRKNRKILLNEEKTEIVCDHAKFLGFVIDHGKVTPNQKAIDNFKNRIAIAWEQNHEEDLKPAIAKTIKLWSNYFVQGYTDEAIWKELDEWVIEKTGLDRRDYLDTISLSRRWKTVSPGH